MIFKSFNIKIYKIGYMKNYKFILFIIVASLMLYLSQVSYKDFSLNKSISACIIAQMKKK